jgi:DNA-binding MarR family transcriptional regulator
MLTIQELHRALGGNILRGKNGPEVLCPGPGHSREDRSLSVTISGGGDDIIVHSFAGDDPIVCKDYVRDKIGLRFQPRSNGHSRPERTLTKIYDYTDEGGQLLFQALRYAPKDFRQRRPDGRGGWISNLDGVRRVPYRLPELIEALANDRPVFVVEGEKDVDALWSIGVPATCNPQGAGKWRDEYSEHFKGATVYILTDNDKPGRDHAEQVASSLATIAAKVHRIELPGLPEKGDVSDWLKGGGSAEQLYALAEKPIDDKPICGPRLLNSADFVRDFVPPDYLIAGILQRRFIYAITGRTGEGKTAVCLRIAAHVASGLQLDKAVVSQGRVLYLAGENPDDIRMRWIVLMEQMGLDENDIAVDFVDGRFSISEIPAHILAAAKAHEYVLVIVDTSVAFSQSVDENDNVEQLKHAQALRGLIDVLPGDPTILVCCHPPKNATDDNLQPRGGGAVIAEFDGNLTCRRVEMATVLHHQGKFRGPDFAPIHFLLQGQTTARLKDSNGQQIWTVFAKPTSEAEQEEISKALRGDLIAIMGLIQDDPGISLAQIAGKLGWYNSQKNVDRSKVQRRIRTLESKKYVERDDDRIELTKKGADYLAKVKLRK